ncbi:MAG TPA: hypothetical protein DDW76_18285 [Cyanobacteria bacterium UBA11369]|nr:hypothetical protein [Cyanobacteria bacterium UBA11371]HBE31152.1 hypothetical protein [Cyanobacteria bacterium UBA11368]HBE50663.1 hypothetical protein [Cyanobacteria bacterium UBA11369]
MSTSLRLTLQAFTQKAFNFYKTLQKCGRVQDRLLISGSEIKPKVNFCQQSDILRRIQGLNLR